MKIYLFFLLSISCLFLNAQSSCSSLHPYFSGFCSTYYENDSLEWMKQYERGKPIGIWMKFDRKGKLVKQLDVTTKWDSITKADEKAIKLRESLEIVAPIDEPSHFVLSKINDSVEVFVDVEAEFPSGPGALNRFIAENVKYPRVSFEMQEQGKVYIECIVEKDGSLSSIKVIKGVNSEIDAEALRVVKLMPKWVPAKLNGKVCRSRTRIQIKFLIA